MDESEYTYRLPRWFIAAIVVFGFGTPFFSFVATAESRTDDLRFTKPLQAASQCTGASVFARLKSIDSEIETLRQERQSLIVRLETFVRGKGEE